MADNPYRFTVSVRPSRWHRIHGAIRYKVEMHVTPSMDLPTEFKSEAEANEHADMILTALQGATRD